MSARRFPEVHLDGAGRVARTRQKLWLTSVVIRIKDKGSKITPDNLIDELIAQGFKIVRASE